MSNPNTNPPNILFVFADQLRYTALGGSGNPDLQTPNLDRLAHDGIVFDGAFSSCPICSPYRAQLITGRYAHTNGVVCNEYRLFDDQTTIAHMLKPHGYKSMYVGKWHLGYGPYTPPKRYGFDDMYAYNNGHSYYRINYWHNEEGPFRMVDYAPRVETDLAIQAIRNRKKNDPDKPFCLFMSWGPPHWNALSKERRYGDYPQEYNLYDPAEVAVPGNVPLQYRDFARKEIADYYGMVTSLDDCMGRLLEELDGLGLAEDTIVCFSSDHGDHLNSHGMGTPADRWMHHTLTGSKATPYDESIHIPFILRYPRAVEPLRRTDVPFNSVDVLPTILGLCGLSVPDDVQGTDLSHLARGETGQEPDSVYLQILGPGWPTRDKWIGLWRGIRTRDYLYARWKDRGGLRVLYDRRTDALEMHHVVHDSENAAVADRLEARLKRWMEQTRDPFDTGKRLPGTDMLDLGQAFTHTLWHAQGPPDYVAAIAENHKQFTTGDQEYLPPPTRNWEISSRRTIGHFRAGPFEMGGEQRLTRGGQE